MTKGKKKTDARKTGKSTMPNLITPSRRARHAALKNITLSIGRENLHGDRHTRTQRKPKKNNVIN